MVRDINNAAKDAVWAWFPFGCIGNVNEIKEEEMILWLTQLNDQALY